MQTSKNQIHVDTTERTVNRRKSAKRSRNLKNFESAKNWNFYKKANRPHLVDAVLDGTISIHLVVALLGYGLD
jgi:hypothetical protein